MDSGERRLAAIVVADVVGYSAMMSEDEDGTLSAVRAHRNATDPVILNRGGRIVKGTGDGVLVEFPSAVAAVNAAVKARPDFSCAKHKSRLIYTREEHRDHIIDGLLKAGLPE